MANVKLSEVGVNSRAPVNAIQVFADNTARDAHTYASTDKGKIVAVGSSTYTLYAITAVASGVATFSAVGGSGGPSGALTFSAVRTANFAMTAGEISRVDPVGIGAGTVTGTFPATPALGDRVGVLCILGSSTPGDFFLLDPGAGTISGYAGAVSVYANDEGSLFLFTWDGFSWRPEDMQAWIAQSILGAGCVTKGSTGIPDCTTFNLADAGLVVKSPAGSMSPLVLVDNEMPGNVGGAIVAMSRLNVAELIVDTIHWVTGNVTGSLSAEPNRGYHLTPGGGGQIVDLPDITTVPDGAVCAFVKNEAGADPIQYTPASTDKIFEAVIGPGVAGAGVTVLTAWHTIKFKASLHLLAWIRSDQL